MSEDRFSEGFDFIGYGRFAGPPTRQDLDRYCFLDDADLKLVAKRRGDANRLGFSVQLVTVRYLATFLADPLDVPTEVVDYLAEQLGIADPSCLKAYLGREKTRFEHQWEIAREDGWRDFADAEDETARWIDDRAWITGDGPGTLFDAAVGWLRERQVLLPAASTLERLVGRVGEEASQRFWNALATIPTSAQAGELEVLLEVAPGSRLSDLDRLRQGPVMGLRQVDVALPGPEGRDRGLRLRWCGPVRSATRLSGHHLWRSPGGSGLPIQARRARMTLICGEGHFAFLAQTQGGEEIA